MPPNGQVQAVAELRRQHFSDEFCRVIGVPYCGHCWKPWPCDVMKVLARYGCDQIGAAS